MAPVGLGSPCSLSRILANTPHCLRFASRSEHSEVRLARSLCPVSAVSHGVPSDFSPTSAFGLLSASAPVKARLAGLLILTRC